MINNEKLFNYDNLFFNDPLKIPAGDIIQVSELSLRKGAEIPKHSQMCDEITYVVSGSGICYSNDEKYSLHEGQVHFTKKDTIHRIICSQNENLRYICIGITLDNNEKNIASFNKKLMNSTSFVFDDNGIIKSLSEYLVREFYNWDEYSVEMINMYVCQLFNTLTRMLEGKNFAYYQNSTVKSENYAMYKLLRHLDREYLQIKSIRTDVADRLSYSEYYLSHLFKEKMGMTIKDYILKKKIAHGIELLITSELSVDRISEVIGFSSAHSFRRVFKETTGITPSNYRKFTDKTE